jgi:hypothetical protein
MDATRLRSRRGSDLLRDLNVSSKNEDIGVGKGDARLVVASSHRHIVGNWGAAVFSDHFGQASKRHF